VTPRTARTSSPDRALVERAIAFEREYGRHATGRVEQHPLGEWHRSDEHPQMWILNQLHVVGPQPDLTADALTAELDRGLADARHRRAVVADDETGRRLAEDFARRDGWVGTALMVMLLDAEPPATEGIAREVDEPTLRALEEQITAENPDVPERDRPVVLAGHAHLRNTVAGTRRFVGARDGTDACMTTLYCDGHTGQPEDVGTLSAHRGHGLAAATVGLATREAVAAGCDLVFILCDAASGPFGLYAGLGYRATGRFWTFTRPG
jgi:GNAT superfamily N-acetyltransferase